MCSKRELRLLVAGTFFSCLLQAAPGVTMECAKKIPFSVTYKNPGKDPILVEVVDSDGYIISQSSEFVKSTTGLKIDKPYLCYQDKDTNVIQAVKFVDGKKERVAGLIVARDFGVNLSKISIDEAGKITPTYKKVKKPKISALVKLPEKSGDWYIVSGDKQYSESAAKMPRKDKLGRLQEMGILQILKVHSKKKNAKLNLYKNEDLQIYVVHAKEPTIQGHMNKISATTVAAAGPNPVVVIDLQGKAEVVSKDAATTL